MDARCSKLVKVIAKYQDIFHDTVSNIHLKMYLSNNENYAWFPFQNNWSFVSTILAEWVETWSVYEGHILLIQAAKGDAVILI